MKQTPFVLNRREAALACCLAAFVFLASGPAWAGLIGSKHDFTGTDVPGRISLAPGGACSTCHIPHAGQPDSVIWPRPLDEETNYFNQRSDPNYVRGYTILCYDCHDNHAITGAVDDNPSDAWFKSDRLPQDVAFDDHMKTTIPRDGDPLDNTKPGYYENIPSRTAGFPVTGSSASTYISGHYIKNNPGIGGINKGDKLPCEDCHDPHSTVNQAFIRASLAGKSLSGKKASTNMAYDLSIRDDVDSRNICIACHGTSEQASYKAVLFNAVNPLYGSETIAKPPASISAHLSSSTTACTNCHPHNGIGVSCTDCHGFPPLRTYAQAGNNYFNKTSYPDVENYLGGAGAHQRHKDALGDAIFQCGLCHGPDAGSASWHNQSLAVLNGTSNPGQNVDIMGQSAYWNPAPGGRTPAYNGVTVTGPLGYSFKAKGGGEQRCSGLACHGNAPGTGTPYLKWTNDLVDETTGAWGTDVTGGTNGANICKWCHSGTPLPPSTIDGGTTYAPNIMGNGLATAAGFGAEVNGHGVGPGAVKTAYDLSAVNAGDGKAGAAKDCTVCHDARYETNPAPPPTNRPVKTHFDGSYDSAEKRLWSGATHLVNGRTISATPADAPNELCVACHQNAGTDAGTQVAHHSNTASSYTPLEPLFTRVCRQCHNVHGANWNGTGRNLYMIGTWIDSDNDGTNDAGEGAYVDSNATDTTVNITVAEDHAVVFTSRTGTNSFDEVDTVGTQDLDDICATCHQTTTRGGDHSGTTGMTDERGNDCTTCHAHADAFMPMAGGCEGCHNGTRTNTLAPNVMGDGTSAAGTGTSPKPYDDGTWGYNVNGHGANGTANNTPKEEIAPGVFVPYLEPNKACADCHDISQPASGDGRHLNGILNSVDGKSNPSVNTAHLRTDTTYSFIKAVPVNAYDVQSTFDTACRMRCHNGASVANMRHAKTHTPNVWNNYNNLLNVARFGDMGAVEDGESISYPIDSALTTNASTAADDFAPCISCHNPHGTAVVESTTNTNRMVRDKWVEAPNPLCKVCH